ncbi:hypothetical protein [Sphingomonas sp.]|uniref:hypothetical protein n=1 Tax=Sphingomonas sp. TaxID=28214 RepID=UPI0035C7C586
MLRRAPRSDMRLRACSVTLLGMLSLTACTKDTTPYPSLAPRPAEAIGFEEPAPPPPASVTADPELDARVARLVRQREEAVAAFDRGAARAEGLARAARGSSAGSERWLDAQTALAELDALRAAHGDAVTGLEDLAATRAQGLQPAYPALESALSASRATAAAQTRRIDAIAAMLAPA